MGYWQKFKERRRFRSVIGAATEKQEPGAVSAFLRDHPEKAKEIAQEALRKCELRAPWHSLLLAVGLAKAQAPQTVEILERLVETNFAGWKRIPSRHVQSLARYLQQNNQFELFSKLVHCVGTSCLKQLPLPSLESRAYSDWLKIYVAAGISIEPATDQLAGYLESLANGKALPQGAGLGLENIVQASELLWRNGLFEEALCTLSLLEAVQPDLISTQVLEEIASRLPDMVPGRPAPLRDSGLNPQLQKLFEQRRRDNIPPIPLRVIRSAWLLARHPSETWIAPLKKCWVRLDELARRPHEEMSEYQIPASLSIAANSVAAALGSCSARHRSLQVEPSDGRFQKIQNALQDRIKQRNMRLDKYNRMIEKFQNARSRLSSTREIEEEILKARDKISSDDQVIESLYGQVKLNLSPAALLLQTLNDGQSYTPELRQGAAWGLYKLRGALNEEGREQVMTAIRNALYREVRLEEIETHLEGSLPAEPALRELALDAVKRFLGTRNLQALHRQLQEILCNDPDRKATIVRIVEASLSKHTSYEFRERLIQLMPGFRLLEVDRVLQEGLEWMNDLFGEADREYREKARLCRNLKWVIQLLRELLPGAVAFLERYPLRLMTLEQHKQILGQYSRYKCAISQWTRYTPPLWKRNAEPEDVGVVHKRYLRLDDRSAPNAMGIYFRLFEHPILALPVIYHEFLHYGGPAGDPANGIKNETEVLIREMLFARYLIARLAPKKDEDINDFERDLVQSVQAVGMDGLGVQLNYDVEDDNCFNDICNQIEKSYGMPLDDDESRKLIDLLIKRRNNLIYLENQINEMKRSWHPEIEWPLLATKETKLLTEQFRAILQEDLTYDHRIGRTERDKILQDPVCQECIRAWKGYTGRLGALGEFRRTWPARGISVGQLLELIVSRFELRD